MIRICTDTVKMGLGFDLLVQRKVISGSLHVLLNCKHTLQEVNLLLSYLVDTPHNSEDTASLTG